MFGKDDLAKSIKLFLQDNGLDPLYTITIFSILITLSYHKVYKNWKNQEGWRKGLAGSSLYASIIFIVMSILRIIGIINY